jgi:hypothetical protein
VVFGGDLVLGKRPVMSHVIQAEQMDSWLHDMTTAAGSAQGLAIQSEMTLGAGRNGRLRLVWSREGRKGRNKEEGEATIEVVNVDFGTNEGQGIGTGQAEAAEEEQGSQGGSAQASPVSNTTDRGFTSEFSQDDQGEDGGKRVAPTARFAGIGKLGEEGDERGRVDGGGGRREDEVGQKRARLHEQSFPALWLRFHHLPL